MIVTYNWSFAVRNGNPWNTEMTCRILNLHIQSSVGFSAVPREGRRGKRWERGGAGGWGGGWGVGGASVQMLTRDVEKISILL